MKKVLCILLAVMALLVSCGSNSDPWTEAIYKEDKVFGDGKKTVVVEVAVLENRVNFTINTDVETLGEALVSHKLIEGDEGPYGLYIKKVNGILADYDKNRAYWAFTKNGETMLSGVDTTEISNGEHYEFTFTK